MLVSARESWPSPLILPFALAVTTVPLTFDPPGIAVLLPTLTGCASVARKVWPVWLVLELSAWSTLTVRTVPAGTTVGCGGGGGVAIGWAACSAAGSTAN